MKVGSLAILLNDAGLFADALGGSVAREDLRQFRTLFDGHESLTVAKLAEKIGKAKQTADAGSSPAILRLQNVLQRLQALLVSGGGKAAAKDVEQLVDLLQNCAHPTIAQFTEQARGWAATKPAITRATPGRGKKPPVEDVSPAELVRRYSEELAAVSKDNVAFDEMVLRLKADKRVRKQEMRDIAQNFLGYEIAKKKGRGDALQDIVDRQALDARQEARGQSHGRMKSW